MIVANDWEIKAAQIEYLRHKLYYKTCYNMTFEQYLSWYLFWLKEAPCN